MPYLFCLPFPNHASDSGDLYIDFNRNHLTFPVELLDFHVEARFMHFLSHLAFCIPHRIPHSISSLHHIAWSLHVVDCILVACLSCWVEPGDISLTRSPLSLLSRIQSTLSTLRARWSYPRNHLYLCFVRCSLFCYAYATMPTTCLSCLPIFHVKPLTHHVLANRWLAMLPLCSAPLIVLLVAGED